MAEMFGVRRACLESVKHYRRQTERVASEREQRLAAGGLAGTSSHVPRAWVKPGEGGAADKANRRLPPERRSRAGMPSRDRGRRAKGNGDRAAVAEVCFVDAKAAR